jgi:hypothetical protein
VKKVLCRLVLVVALLALGVWGWRVFFPDPEQVIRKQLAKLARTATFSSNEAAMARLWNAQAFGNFFTSDVEISVEAPGGSPVTMAGRDNLVGQVLAARSAMGGLRVEFPDVSVTIGPDNVSATAYVTAKAKAAGERDPYLQELKFTLQKVGRDWLIRKVESSKTLSRLKPSAVPAYPEI